MVVVVIIGVVDDVVAGVVVGVVVVCGRWWSLVVCGCCVWLMLMVWLLIRLLCVFIYLVFCSVDT